VRTPLIESIDVTNQLQITRAVSMIQATGKRNLGFMGLSFKAGTDDLRNSPAVTLIETLLGKGYTITIYDSNVSLSKLTGTNKEYIDRHIPHLSRLLTQDLQELAGVSEVLVVNNKETDYIDFLQQLESDHHVIDMVRLPEAIRQKKNYQGINW